MPSHDHAGYERRDVNMKRLFTVTLVVLVLIVIIIYAMNEYFFMARENLVYETVLKPESAELRELAVREAETLHTYKVLDAQQGRYQIPIERAMELLASEHYQAQTTVKVK